MTESDLWAFLEEIGYTTHLTVWFTIHRLEADDAERINSRTVRKELESPTGEGRTIQSVLTSMGRLLEADVIEREELEERSHGYNWRTTERGRAVAEAFAEEWGHVLEIGGISKSDTADD